ncbi:F-box domain, cyclin-like protein [Pochonia chlamydosporia 170]|uniref:F-box domain, cyclin-like protein n=1 Tax=Pochonia chlamydosporia 170 TaxID=1380566 RepID=A0A179FHM7_METCM|nr:F-box domain, cyclin-like protein [Pochonia chlamydosporia 170]OAQ65044.1 F-box domain, cyclin-like protein [Pochonia chlamydosporia 170]
MKPPYLAREVYHFDYFSGQFSGLLSSDFEQYGTNAPPVQVLEDSPPAAGHTRSPVGASSSPVQVLTDLLPTTSYTKSPAGKSRSRWLQLAIAKFFDKFLENMGARKQRKEKDYCHSKGSDAKAREVSTESTESTESTPAASSDVCLMNIPAAGSEASFVTAPAASPGVSIMAMPNELLLQVMGHLSAPSLYCLRQTSGRFMDLFDLKDFKGFHQEVGISSIHKMFNMKLLCAADKNMIANSLHHEMYCAPCLAAEECGTLADRLETLRSLRYCHGCKRLHAAALFPPEDNHDTKQVGVCIGRVGHVTLCNHNSCSPTTWRDIEHYVPPGRYPHLFGHSDACTDRAHQPDWKYNERIGSVGSPFPRLYGRRTWQRPILIFNPVFQVAYGWDLPLLEVGQRYRYRPSLDSIHKKLRSLLEAGALHNHRLCPHVSPDNEIRKFVRSGICDCFRRGVGNTIYNCFEDCECKRQVVLECRLCGSIYMWLSNWNRIIFSRRHLWHIQRPTSPGWLSLLDKEWQQMHFTEDNRHVLWCDVPHCRTNRRGRWEALVKEESEREYLESNGDNSQDFWDYKEAMIASESGSFQNWRNINNVRERQEALTSVPIVLVIPIKTIISGVVNGTQLGFTALGKAYTSAVPDDRKVDTQAVSDEINTDLQNCYEAYLS